ncbi:hypothetical protein [Chitinophaga sp. LS1]|uniref:hypothetical protein n=1 Tax=Chitinophaga sp. LS1 TaxID=3051176 RepID=UPI002AAB5E89|nr:hypothetical protein [Chitinophaga sp. LS1]WPV70486.1 hypothetical protein QQL36_17400 [Chitinophaga sp. LS1]
MLPIQHSAICHNYKALLEMDDTVALEALKLANNILGDPEIKPGYDLALQDHLNLIRSSLNYYAILNIPDFTEVQDEIYDGRFYEVMRFQPPEDHVEALAYVAAAYEVLSDLEKKEKYDAELRIRVGYH